MSALVDSERRVASPALTRIHFTWLTGEEAAALDRPVAGSAGGTDIGSGT